MNAYKLFSLLLVSALAGGIFSVVFLKLFFPGKAEAPVFNSSAMRTEHPDTTLSPEVSYPAADALSLQSDFSATIQNAMPAVVLITTQKRIGVISESPYSNLFDYRQRRIDYMDVPSGQGSGFFIRDDGYVLTNFHVIRGQDSLWVSTHDGKEYPARVIGIDPPTDLAVLKVEVQEKFPVLEFADQEELRIGHWAIAIGAPFSLNRTVTVGIVSNKKRSGVGVNLHESYVQTDASINPGNSGGPLLNIGGKVIGVNDFILSPSGGSIGLSFAISSDIAKQVSDELIRSGHIERPWLGIVMNALGREERKKLNLNTGGVLVSQIFRNSPAADQLHAGDIILSANGKAVDSPNDLQGCVYSLQPDATLSLEILRSGKKHTVEIMMRKSPPNWYNRGSSSSGNSAEFVRLL